jgi:hypothetical protein
MPQRVINNFSAEIVMAKYKSLSVENNPCPLKCSKSKQKRGISRIYFLDENTKNC